MLRLRRLTGPRLERRCCLPRAERPLDQQAAQPLAPHPTHHRHDLAPPAAERGHRDTLRSAAVHRQTTPPSPDHPPYHSSAWRTQQDPRLRTNVDQLSASVRSRRTAANTASARAPSPAPARLHQQPRQCACRLPGTLRRQPAADNTEARQRNPALRKKLGNVPSARA